MSVGVSRGRIIGSVAVIAGCFLAILLQSAYGDAKAPGQIDGPKTKIAIYLYFADRSAPVLKAEPRTVELPEDPTAAGLLVLDELVAGPRQDAMATLAADTTIRGFYTTADGTAYVDLPRQVVTGFAGGIRKELTTLYSIVNSLVLNIPQIETVKFLVEGAEADTFGGHIDLSLPFEADILMMQ